LIAMTKTAREAAESTAQCWSTGEVRVDDSLDSPFIQIGTLGQIVESLEAGRETPPFRWRPRSALAGVAPLAGR
jgi:hypothetical protein